MRSRSLPQWTFVLLVLLLLLGAIEMVWNRVRESRLFAPDGAEWIWPNLEDHRKPQPLSFVVFRDFSIEDLPDSALLTTTVDEELRLFLNGRELLRIRNLPGETERIERVEVASFLNRGRNRVSAELRSSRAVGGFLLCLEIQGQCEVATDENWKSLDRWEPGVHRGWWPEEVGEEVQSWFSAPQGRWDLPGETSRSVIWKDCRTHEELRGLSLGPVEPANEAPFGRQIFDLGSEDRGYLRIRASDHSEFLAFLRMAPTLEGLTDWDGRTAIPLIPLSNRKDWVSTEILSGRYVEVTGFPVRSVVLDRIVPGCDSETPLRPREGLSALGPSRSMTPMENEIRRRLQGLAGRTIGEEP